MVGENYIFWIIYVCLIIPELTLFIYYTREQIHFYAKEGIDNKPIFVYSNISQFWIRYIGFISLLIGLLAINYEALFVYLMFTSKSIIQIALNTIYSIHTKVSIFYTFVLIVQLVYVLFNWNNLTKHVVFHFYKLIGSNIHLKNAYMVSKNIIRHVF